MAIVDLAFNVSGKELPVDHAYALFSSLCRLVPELHGDQSVGVHSIRGRLIGNRMMALTKRSRLVIRLDHERIPDVYHLAGKSLLVAGHTIRLGVPQIYMLEAEPELYSPLVVIKGFTEPEPFLDAVKRQLMNLDVDGDARLIPQLRIAEANKGKATGSRSPFLRRTLNINGYEIVGFAVQVSNLSAEGSLKLQESGIGGRRRMGCGLFVRRRRNGENQVPNAAS